MFLPVDFFQADELLQSLPFQKVVHQIATLDAQPSNESGGILVMVTGALLVWQALNILTSSSILRRSGRIAGEAQIVWLTRKIYVGGRGAATDELYPGVSVAPGRQWQLFHLQ